MLQIESEFHNFEKGNLWPKVFQDIRDECSKYKYTTKEAKKSDNRNLNRYRDVTPYDHSRVSLKKLDKDYINASLVRVEEADRAYILTQGPLPMTVGHFWLMVWEQNTVAILMLNKLIERGQLKCSQYWPDSSNDDSHLDNSELVLKDVELKVTFVKHFDKEHYIIRQFLLYNLENEESRLVTQFHYISWPDFGLPESPTSFLQFLRAVQESKLLNQDTYGPPVVHCSAGIGRSGTFCLADTCLVLAEKYRSLDMIDVKQILLKMRKDRMGLIQTPEQLRFSYLAIIEGAKNIFNTNNVPLSDEDNQNETHEISPTIPNNVNYDGDNVLHSTLPPLPPRTKQYQTSSPERRSSNDSLSPLTPSVLLNNEISNTDNDAEQVNDEKQPLLESPTNNNISSELRRRAREDRKQKTMDMINRIKYKQKNVEYRSRVKKQIVKISCISLGAALILGSGYLFYHYLNGSTVSDYSFVRPFGN